MWNAGIQDWIMQEQVLESGPMFNEKRVHVLRNTECDFAFNMTWTFSKKVLAFDQDKLSDLHFTILALQSEWPWTLDFVNAFSLLCCQAFDLWRTHLAQMISSHFSSKKTPDLKSLLFALQSIWLSFDFLLPKPVARFSPTFWRNLERQSAGSSSETKGNGTFFFFWCSDLTCVCSTIAK